MDVKQLHAGATWALDQLVAQSPIGEALKRAFPQRRDYLKVLSIAYFIILNQDNNISKYPTFAEATRLPWGGALHPSSIGRVFRKIKKQQIENYFSAIQEGLIEQKKKNGDDDRLTLALDSTSISSYANKLPNVERGRNKDEDNLPQINLLMLVESKSGLPIFYRTYDGNVPDVQTVRRVIADNSRLGIQNVVLVSDRGYSGTKNINDCLRNKVGFLFNMKCGISGSLTQELIDEERVNLQDLNRMDWFTQVFQVTKKISWIYEPNPVTGQRSTKKTQETAELYWHIYFDRQIAENARQGMFERIIRIREKMAAGKSLDENEQTLLEEVFVKHEKDSTVSYSVDNKKVD
ncbi:transposase, partial [uncultured Parasutterella sp.]|uniref:IS1634 family transposase n=1 Tax=uncultured Parasutterella sp. TaxID=1263098 RepID=UPI0025915E00